MATNEKNSIIDETRFDVNEQIETAAYPVTENEFAKTNNKSGIKNVMAAATGVTAGVGGAVLITGFRHPETETEPLSESESDLELFDGKETPIAQNISNDMSFDEAFAAARKEVGAGGIFSWRGGTYGTYYADEWQGFSDEYKRIFSNYPYNIQHDPYIAAAPQPVEAEIANDFPANELPPAEIVMAEESLTDDFQSDTVEITDDFNPEEVLIIPEDEIDVDVSVLNPYPTEIEVQEITIVNDSDDPVNLLEEESGYEVTPVDPVEELTDIPDVDDSIYDNPDESIDLPDFNNNADISNFD